MRFARVDTDPEQGQVRRITFVPFLEDGQCLLIEAPDGPQLPSGDVLPGEDYLLDTVLRVPLETAGFRYQRFRAVGLDGHHLYAWIEGERYAGSRPHATVELAQLPAEAAAARLQVAGQPELADVVTAAAQSYRSLDEESFYSDNTRRLERAYLRADTAPGGSGFGGSDEQWRQARQHITEGMTADGTFLDVGCANGLLMESVAAWCAERGLQIEPYGVDLSPGLVDLARRRLPQWADRIWAGNAISWLPPGDLRFDYVHVLIDCVPRQRRGDLIRHHLAHTVRPGTGRMLVSEYGATPAAGGTAADILRDLGFAPVGQSSGSCRPDYPPDPTAWLDAATS